MRRIIQKDTTGCGIACVAMLTRQPYSKIKELLLKMPGFTEDDYFYTDASDLRALVLAASKHKVILAKRMRKFTCWSNIPDKSLLAIKYKKGKNKQKSRWHWVVFNRINNSEYVVDPSKSVETNKRTDFIKIKVKWHLPVFSV